MRECVAFIHDPNMMLTFELKVKFIEFLTWLCVWATAFLSIDSNTISGTWVFNHRIMCHIHSWSLYDLDLWPQYQNYIFTMNFCMGKIFFALWPRHTKFGSWVYHHETTCCIHSWPVYDLDFDLYVVAGVSLVSFTHSFYLVIVWNTCWSQMWLQFYFQLHSNRSVSLFSSHWRWIDLF